MKFNDIEAVTAHKHLEHSNVITEPLVKLEIIEDDDDNHAQVKKSFPCDKCERIFNRLDNFKRHISIKHDKQRRFKCSECAKIYAFKQSLEFHMTTVHSGLKIELEKQPVKCEKCDKICASAKALNIHTTIKHCPEELKLNCDHCGKLFRKKELLDKHRFQVHQIRDFLNCVDCGENFKEFGDFKQHKCAKSSRIVEVNVDDDTLDPDVKPLKCEDCFSCFKNEMDMKEHVCAKSDDPLK